MTNLNIAGSGAAGPEPSPPGGDWDIRILRRVGRLEDFPLATDPVAPIRHVAVVDVETTGIDPLLHQVIDIAYVVLAVDARGEFVDIVRKGQSLCDPGMPIPPRITMLTGLTDEHVRGTAIDLDALQQIFATVDVFVAQNCAFDAGFLRQLLPSTKDAAWACSLRDFDWLKDAGLDGRALGHLLMQIGFFNDGHRALNDVISLIHLLAWRLPSDQTVMGALLANAERETVRLEATGAGFGNRSLLKARGYRWDVAAKVWWIEVTYGELDEERLWLQREVTPFGPYPRIRPITWHQRHR